MVLIEACGNRLTKGITKTDKKNRMKRQGTIDGHVTVKPEFHAVNELNRMNRGLHGKESFPVGAIGKRAVEMRTTALGTRRVHLPHSIVELGATAASNNTFHRTILAAPHPKSPVNILR